MCVGDGQWLVLLVLVLGVMMLLCMLSMEVLSVLVSMLLVYLWCVICVCYVGGGMWIHQMLLVVSVRLLVLGGVCVWVCVGVCWFGICGGGGVGVDSDVGAVVADVGVIAGIAGVVVTVV